MIQFRIAECIQDAPSRVFFVAKLLSAGVHGKIWNKEFFTAKIAKCAKEETFKMQLRKGKDLQKHPFESCLVNLAVQFLPIFTRIFHGASLNPGSLAVL